jgi:uncharacterized RDD family membrane protein YckC
LSTDFFLAAMSQVVAPNATTSVASIWRRCSAYFADSILLGFVGAGIVRIPSERLWQLGPYGVFVGFFVSALYFAASECRIGNGQSLGKRLFKVRVVDGQGNPISFEKALARYIIFAIPAIAYGLKLPETRTPWAVTALIFVLVLWVGGSTLYLIIFERPNRQGLHDMAVGSFVVSADHEGPVSARPVPQMQWMILGSLLLAITGCAAAINGWTEKQPAPLEFRRDARLLENMNGVDRARVGDRLAHGLSGGPKKTLYISVTRETKPASEDALAYDLVKTLFRSDQNLQGYDLVNVRLFYGYDIGIARHSEHREFEQSPADWLKH